MNVFDKERMQKMSVLTGDTDDVTQYTVFPSADSQVFSYFSYLCGDKFIVRFIGAVSVCLLIYALFFTQTTRNTNANNINGIGESYSGNERQIFVRPKQLRNLLHSVAVRAKDEGALSSMAISAPEYVMDNGIEVRHQL